MICATKPTVVSRSKHPVTEILELTAAQHITVELVGPEEEARWNKLVRQHHYLKEHRMVGESLRYVAKQNGQWIALLGWSSAAFHLRPRDAWIGWNEAQRNAGRHLIACNARFALLTPKSQSPNLAAHLLSLNLKRLSEDWQQQYHHPLLLVETYVDPQRFEGTCYRAANWVEIGVTKGFGRSRIDFYQLHAQPKAILHYPLHPQARQILSAPVMPPAWAPYRRQPQRRDYLRSLRASRCRKTGKFIAPSETTIRRVLQRLDPAQLNSIVSDWLRSHLKNLDIAALAVDGKCVRTAAKINGQAIQLFGALDVQTQLFCRPIPIPAKTNEIPCLKDLLKELDLRGTLVTTDALNTQKASAALVVEEKQADYLMVVKANQPKLFDQLARLAQAPQGVFFPSRH